MSNIATALKAEISRICRKEVRQATEPLKSTNARYRSQIAALKRDLSKQQTEVARLRKALGSGGEAPPVKASDETETAHRFNAAGFAKLRAKLDISAREMAQLLGVSQLSVYKWESGKTRPRRAQLEAIASVRPLGKREVQKRLAELGASGG